MSLAPRVLKQSYRVAAVATAGNSLNTNLGEPPFAGTVSSVEFVADAAITGAATNHRSVSLVNKGTAGTGTTVVATLAFDNGVDATAHDAKVITLSGTAANLMVTADDVLQWQSAAVGTGIADPGGAVVLEFSATTTPA